MNCMTSYDFRYSLSPELLSFVLWLVRSKKTPSKSLFVNYVESIILVEDAIFDKHFSRCHYGSISLYLDYTVLYSTVAA